MKFKNLTLFMAFCLFTGWILADGKAFSGKDYHSMYPIREDDQRAIISHKDGIQKMLIAVSLPLKDDEKAIWIFPVPGNENSVKIDLFDKYPTLDGYDPITVACDALSDFSYSLLCTQIIPAFCCPWGTLAGSDMRILSSVEKWGLHTEVISADSLAAITNYLKTKNVVIKDSDLEAFADYLNSNYVLVLTWIESTQDLIKHFPEYKNSSESKSRWPAVYVEFPTESPYYPMKPTSDYGPEVIDIYICLFGNYDLTNNNNYRIKQFRQPERPKDLPSTIQQDIPEKSFWYTAVTYNGLADQLTNDLYFQQVSSPDTRYADLLFMLTGTPWTMALSWIVFMAAISYLSGGISGMLIYHKWKGYAAFGLTNMLTILFLLFMAYRKNESLNEKLTLNGTAPYRRLIYVILFPFLFCLLTILIMILISLPLKQI